MSLQDAPIAQGVECVHRSMRWTVHAHPGAEHLQRAAPKAKARGEYLLLPLHVLMSECFS
jgi:hypothetical protein